MSRFTSTASAERHREGSRRGGLQTGQRYSGRVTVTDEQAERNGLQGVMARQELRRQRLHVLRSIVGASCFPALYNRAIEDLIERGLIVRDRHYRQLVHITEKGREVLAASRHRQGLP